MFYASMYGQSASRMHMQATCMAQRYVQIACRTRVCHCKAVALLLSYAVAFSSNRTQLYCCWRCYNESLSRQCAYFATTTTTNLSALNHLLPLRVYRLVLSSESSTLCTATAVHFTHARVCSALHINASILFSQTASIPFARQPAHPESLNPLLAAAYLLGDAVAQLGQWPQASEDYAFLGG